MKPLILITIFSLASCAAGHSQSFEGKIVYRLSIESPDPKRISPEQIKMMFNDVDTTCILYLKGDYYKFVTLDRESAKAKVVNQYDPVLNKIYDYVLTDSISDPFVMQTENPTTTFVFKKRKGREKVSILGEPCEAITLDYGSHYTMLYFSDRYKVSSRGIRKDAPSFLQYLRECEAVPLKIVMSGGGAVHNLVFEAIEIVEGPVDPDVFNLGK